MPIHYSLRPENSADNVPVQRIGDLMVKYPEKGLFIYGNIYLWICARIIDANEPAQHAVSKYSSAVLQKEHVTEHASLNRGVIAGTCNR